MDRRVSKSLVALSFALALCLSSPSASAMSRDRGFDPSFGARISRFFQSVVHHFLPSSFDEQLGPPKP